jgi:hypothetical protein
MKPELQKAYWWKRSSSGQGWNTAFGLQGDIIGCCTGSYVFGLTDHVNIIGFAARGAGAISNPEPEHNYTAISYVYMWFQNGATIHHKRPL